MAATPQLLDDEQDASGQAFGADAAANEAPELTLDANLLAQIAPSKIVEPCPKCGAAMPDEPMPWCRTCGFYPKLGTYFDPDEANDGSVQSAGTMREIPQWAYVLVGGLVVLLVMSLAVRFTTHPLSPMRFYWAIGQLVCGLTVFVAAHMLCFMFASTEDATIGLMDPILRPINIWKPSIFALPKSFRRVATGTWGLGAALCALCIGGIPWERLTDWGDPAPRRKTSLVNAITSRARSEEATSDNLEDAVSDFAGKAGDIKPEEEPIEDPTKRSHEAECVIVGYIPSTVNPKDFVALLVATDLKGKLKIVAQISDGIPDDVHDSLSAQMQELKRERPFIPSKLEAVWIQPKLFCRVGFNDYNSTSRMKDPLFREMLLTPSAAK
jgi:hypothetical protein